MQNADYQLMLITVDGMPPAIKARTEFEYQIWIECREAYQDIHAYLKAYFSGQKIPTIPQEYKLLAQSYIDLYGLIQEAWDDIAAFTANLQMYIPKTPGEYICKVIEGDAISCVHPSDYWEFKPRKLYEWSSFSSKLPLLRAKTNLTKKEELKIKQHESESRKIFAEFKRDWGLWYLVMIAATLSTSPNVKDKLKCYNATKRKISAFCNSNLHPRKGVKGFSVIKGHPKEVS
jgi:hypothetical protein